MEVVKAHMVMVVQFEFQTDKSSTLHWIFFPFSSDFTCVRTSHKVLNTGRSKLSPLLHILSDTSHMNEPYIFSI
jgi:hypothetical protein